MDAESTVEKYFSSFSRSNGGSRKKQATINVTFLFSTRFHNYGINFNRAILFVVSWKNGTKITFSFSLHTTYITKRELDEKKRTTEVSSRENNHL